MSHFSLLIIGPSPEEQLGPFSEHIVVPKYVSLTKEQIISRERKNMKEYKNTYYKKFLENPEEYKKIHNEVHCKYIEEEFPKRLQWTDEQIYDYVILDYSPDSIGPEGEIYSTYNQKSKWDWYELGGRWAGSLKIKDGVDYIPPCFSFGWSPQEIAKVISERRADKALKAHIENLHELNTFAILNNGVWYEQGTIGSFGTSTNNMDEEQWELVTKSILEDTPDDTLISIFDCHI